MKFAFRYLMDHRKLIGIQLLFAGIFAAAFYLYHLPAAAVLYPIWICFLLGCVFLGCSVYQADKKHKSLTALLSLHGNVIENGLREGGSIEERDYQQIIRKLCQEMEASEAQFGEAYEEMMDYFTMWVHQIKTPIASMRLHLDGEDSQLSRKLKSDLLHIEQYVEMVLTYFRMKSASTDYVLCTVPLDKILRENIRKLRGDFIYKKLSLEYEPITETVVSDEKWLSFVIEQILSNALKYTRQGVVSITLENPQILCIRDTGIGIAPEDIPRIFEKGYTGRNGRRDKRASGIGLYLCRQICGRLGIGLTIHSKVDAGTEVRLDLGSSYKIVRSEKEM